jgi:hypothetical protein
MEGATASDTSTTDDPIRFSSIAAAVDRGMTGEHFDLSANVDRGDERQVDPALFAMEAIMEREGCDFDAARLIYNQQKMREAGIDPETGLSLDPKAVTNVEDFERVWEADALTRADDTAARSVCERLLQRFRVVLTSMCVALARAIGLALAPCRPCRRGPVRCELRELRHGDKVFMTELPDHTGSDYVPPTLHASANPLARGL